MLLNTTALWAFWQIYKFVSTSTACSACEHFWQLEYRLWALWQLEQIVGTLTAWAGCEHFDSLGRFWALWQLEYSLWTRWQLGQVVCSLTAYAGCEHFDSLGRLWALWQLEQHVGTLTAWAACGHFDSLSSLRGTLLHLAAKKPTSCFLGNISRILDGWVCAACEAFGNYHLQIACIRTMFTFWSARAFIFLHFINMRIIFCIYKKEYFPTAALVVLYTL